jgi:MFS family permease
MYDLSLAFLRNLNDLLTAGIAITAFSLLLYALSFNLRDRVARSFAFIMLCIVIIYVSESLSSFITSFQQVEFLLRVQWIGIAFLPPAYLHLSDAILETTGRPSRGRRRNAVRLVYLISLAFLIGLPFSVLVGPLVSNTDPAPYLTLTWMSIVFTVFYVIVMSVSWINLWRAMKRTKATASRRRMIYLLVGSLAPALGSYPYLLVGFNFAAAHPLIFWLTVNTFNILVSVFLVLMAYAVAYFGVPWPDRVVKRRLFKWLLRGPVTASTTLALTTFLSRVSAYFNIDISPLIPAVMVTSIVSIEHLITLTAPTFERWLFRERSQSEMELLQSLEDRLLTIDDLQQFLEAVLSAVCDRLQTQNAFIATLNTRGVELFITTSSDSQLEIEPPTAEMLQEVSKNGFEEELFLSLIHI